MNTANVTDKTENREVWTPTPAEMSAYLKRELELAQYNVLVLLGGSRFPMTFKEMKDCMLHTSETLERALLLQIKAGKVKSQTGQDRQGNSVVEYLLPHS
jgi:hypothetical protein